MANITPETNRAAREASKAMWARARASSAPVQNTPPAPLPSLILTLGAPSQLVTNVPPPVTVPPLVQPKINYRTGKVEAAAPVTNETKGDDGKPTPLGRPTAFPKAAPVSNAKGKDGKPAPLVRPVAFPKQGA